MSAGWEDRASQWLASAATSAPAVTGSRRSTPRRRCSTPPARATPRRVRPRGGRGAPFPDASFDLVVAYNVLIDVADMPAVVAEAARVLAPGGCLCGCVPHPFADAGRWASPDDDDSPFVVEGSYLEARRFELEIERGGMTMRFDGMAYPLADYASALEAAGLVIEALREPAAGGVLGHRPEREAWGRWRRIPMFLMFRARRPAAR